MRHYPSKRWLLLMVLLMLPTVAVIMGVLSAKKSQRLDSAETYEKEYASLITGWSEKSYVPIHPLDEFLPQLARVQITGKDVITEQQCVQLIGSLANWFAAYSSGVRETYVSFRFPEKVAWHWKDGALATISNYFSTGIIFSSPQIQDRWMLRYGNPDMITRFAPYADLAQTWSSEKTAEVRERWVAKYGVGNPPFEPPPEPFEMWLLIANDHAGGNWFSNFWTGVCIDESVVVVEEHSVAPEPLKGFRFADHQRPIGYGVGAYFPNQGFSMMDKENTSFIEWDLSYDALLGKQLELVIANVFCFVRCSPPDDPRPMLLRLAYFEEEKEWVPTEMIEGNIVKTHARIPFF